MRESEHIDQCALGVQQVIEHAYFNVSDQTSISGLLVEEFRMINRVASSSEP